MRPAARREAVGHLRRVYGLSERRACRVIRAHRTTMRYQRRQKGDEPQVRERLQEWAAAHPRWGYRRLHLLLRREGLAINRKRVYRLYRLDGLAVRRQKRKRAARGARGVTAPLGQRGEAWAMDFMRDTLASGRCFRTLSVLDTVTRECLAIAVDISLPGQRVARVLDRFGGAARGAEADHGGQRAGVHRSGTGSVGI